MNSRFSILACLLLLSSKRNFRAISDGGGQMFSSLSLSSVASGVLNMTTDFAPLFMGLVVLLGLSVLGIAFAIGMHDSRETERQSASEEDRSLPKAA